MVKHVIIWTLIDGISDEEKEKAKKDIKAGLEGLAGKIPGLIDIKVNIDGLLVKLLLHIINNFFL